MINDSHFICAARFARKLYPGPVGELLEKEILAWLELRFFESMGPESLTLRVINSINADGAARWEEIKNNALG